MAKPKEKKYMLAAFFDDGKEVYKLDLRIIQKELYLVQEGGKKVKLMEIKD